MPALAQKDEYGPCAIDAVSDSDGIVVETMTVLPTCWRTSNSSSDVLKCANEAACSPPTNSTWLGGPFCELCEDNYALSAYEPEYRYWEIVEMVWRIFMAGFLVGELRADHAICLVVRVAMLKSLSSRRPYVKVAGAPDNNNMAEAMLVQTIGTLVLCVQLKTGKEGEYGMLGEGELDLLMVACQFLFVGVLLWKTAKGEKQGVVAPELQKYEPEVDEEKEELKKLLEVGETNMHFFPPPCLTQKWV